MDYGIIILYKSRYFWLKYGNFILIEIIIQNDLSTIFNINKKIFCSKSIDVHAISLIITLHWKRFWDRYIFSFRSIRRFFKEIIFFFFFYSNLPLRLFRFWRSLLSVAFELFSNWIENSNVQIVINIGWIIFFLRF